MKKRIFISFAKEDIRLRDFLVGQSRNDNCPFEFIDMSVKQPWDSAWKTNCRTKIKGCDGVIAFITRNTPNADGELWEIKCAKEEGVPCIGIWGYNDYYRSVPREIMPIHVIDWNWEYIANWIKAI